MAFYLPLTLGVRRRRPAVLNEDRLEAGRRRASYEAWREGLGLAVVEYEEHPAARVLEDLRRAATVGQAKRPWIVLGEPGAGKSTLLRKWCEEWADELPEPHLGSTVPLLVRLRELRPNDMEGDTEAAADLLWREHGAVSAAARSAVRSAGERIYRADRIRTFRPVWLLDGLDEFDDELLRGERLFEWLVALPGAKLITCRTAVFEALREWAEPHKDREFEILPLKPAEQESFLAGALEARGCDPARGKVVHKDIQSNAAVLALAGNPLMLDLIAEVSDRMTLPATRAAFYGQAVEAIWHRKLAWREAERLLEQRDTTLTLLAEQMALDHIEQSVVSLVRTTRKVAAGRDALLRDAFERAGLLRVDPRRGVFGFLHLTLQEFYLARALEPGGLREPLKRHWTNARYEETLALLASLLLEAGRAAEVDRAVCWLLEWGSQTHRPDPRILWQMRRSPLRVGLHLLQRAGMSWNLLPSAKCWLERWLHSSGLGRQAVAGDSGSPEEVLAALARDESERVRELVAQNPATPAEVLAVLARDESEVVRRFVAKNSATPAEVLAALARDESEEVRNGLVGDSATSAEVLAVLARDESEVRRRFAAQNSATPAEVLAALARDESEEVREHVAQNPATPAEVLAVLARDESEELRRLVAKNSAAPAEVLAALARDESAVVRNIALLLVLARDESEEVRTLLAWNSATPAEVFAALARDGSEEVRKRLAWNSATPAEVLAVLARDESEVVRQYVVGNSVTPAEVLAVLARDESEEVRRRFAKDFAEPALVLALARDKSAFVRQGVAENSATPADVLAALARDESVIVRHGVAENSATPADVLAALARDEDIIVRQLVANNSAAPGDVLAALARDEFKGVREFVAQNSATPAKLLAALAQDESESARQAVAYNSAARAEVLAVLARDESEVVRRFVAENSATPAEVLAALARDESEYVRFHAAQNPNVLLEDLAP